MANGPHGRRSPIMSSAAPKRITPLELRRTGQEWQRTLQPSFKRLSRMAALWLLAGRRSLGPFCAARRATSVGTVPIAYLQAIRICWKSTMCLKMLVPQTGLEPVTPSLRMMGRLSDCLAQAAVVIEPVSADSLRKTGIFADKAGDFRRFPPPVGKPGVRETKSNARKAGISGPFSRLLGSLAERRTAWLGREGFEPPHGGIKIPCLTAWLRPNRPSGMRRDGLAAHSSGNAGL